MKELARSIIEKPTAIERWTDELYTNSFWVELSNTADEKLKKYEGTISVNASLFADQLFDGYNFIFASHCMHQYIISGKCTNAKFKEANAFVLLKGKQSLGASRPPRWYNYPLLAYILARFTISYINDGEDFNLDLLFYHRRLKRMVAIDLKLGKFKAA